VTIGIWDGLAVIVKAALYAATFGAAGAVFFLSYSHSLLAPLDRAVIGRRALGLIGVSLAASIVRVLVTAASMSGDASDMFDSGLVSMVWRAGEGRAIVARAAGFLLVLPSLASHRRPAVLGVPGAALAATSFAWVGHGHATVSDLAVVLIGVHLLGGAFWVGALGPLWLLTLRQDVRTLASTAARFGNAALAAVGLLILAGLTVLSILLGEVSELWRSGYGRIACVKLALVACLLAFAALNKLRLTPRLIAGDGRAVRTLRRSIAAEMLLAGCIFIATAALTTLTGPPTLH
jgi:putative copper export protein